MKRLSLCPLPICFAAFWLMLLASPTVQAQMPTVSALRLVPDKTDLFLELTLNPFELTFFPELDVNRDGRLDPGEWAGQGQKMARRIMEALKVCVNDRPRVAEIAGVSQSYETHYIFVRAHFLVDARRARVSLESQLTEVTGAPHVHLHDGFGLRHRATGVNGRSSRQYGICQSRFVIGGLQDKRNGHGRTTRSLPAGLPSAIFFLGARQA